jgi:hypothetical protein
LSDLLHVGVASRLATPCFFGAATSNSQRDMFRAMPLFARNDGIGEDFSDNEQNRLRRIVGITIGGRPAA